MQARGLGRGGAGQGRPSGIPCARLDASAGFALLEAPAQALGEKRELGNPHQLSPLPLPPSLNLALNHLIWIMNYYV